VLLAAGVFRFHRLADRSLWLDEARVANYARQSIADNVTKTRLGSSSPLAYPLLLQVVQHFDDSAFAARSIAAVSSLLAIIVILGLPRVGVDSSAALIAAGILAVSPSQIRYAQEVREYSLSVLLAAVMVFALLSWQRESDGTRAPLLLSLFLAPLVQYGLVLFAVALLVILALATWRRSGLMQALRSLAAAAAVLTTGVTITVALTLRGQWRQGDMSYLRNYFFDGSIFDLSAVYQFLAARIPELMNYLTLGDGNVVLLVPVLGLLFLARPTASREARYLLTLALFSVMTVAAASLARLYPLGAIRQDLFLAPVIAATLGGGWSVLTRFLPTRHRSTATAMLLMIVLAAGTFGVIRANPYKEIEDIKSVIAGLTNRDPGDLVYVYYGAWPALRYYRVGGPDFVFGHSHRRDRGGYAPEFRALVGKETPRVWLVFSHASAREVRRLLHDLSSEWRFKLMVNARGARLYRGERLPEPGSPDG